MRFRGPTLSIASGLLLTTSSFAQLLGPIPPAPAPAPEYTPEKAAKPPEPVETAPLAPFIVKRDDKGRLVAPPNGPEAAALAVYPFDAAQRDKIAKSTA